MISGRGDYKHGQNTERSMAFLNTTMMLKIIPKPESLNNMYVDSANKFISYIFI